MANDMGFVDAKEILNVDGIIGEIFEFVGIFFILGREKTQPFRAGMNRAYCF